MERPNIVLIMTDQQRGDCLGIDGHPVLQTPQLDSFQTLGARFSRAYTECPVCIPARRSMMTGKKPAHQGTMMNYHTRLEGPTLPEMLSRNGYQTHLVGKKHLWPVWKRYGFNSMDWADSPRPPHPFAARTDLNDYHRFLEREGITPNRSAFAHGLDGNGWTVRPFHLDERYHFTNWCAERAVEFLERRDTTMPFFLNVSFVQPHQELAPPQCYYDRYINMDLPEPYVGEWARVFDGPQRGLPVNNTWRMALSPAVMKQYRAAYYASINHIDDQIYRFMRLLPKNTLVFFVSDHGEMLGDHQWNRKRNAYEPSARIPFLMKIPDSMGIEKNRVIDKPVQLMDILPTCLDAAGIAVPDDVDGSSLLALLRNPAAPWREYVHGECSNVPTLESGMQYLTDGRRKYVWFPGTGVEQYFNLEEDPREMNDLAADPAYADEIFAWKERLAVELNGRPEGFVREGRLVKQHGNTSPCIPGYENRA